MDIHSIRQQLRTKSIYDIPLRVTYYARVSSESDEQLNSLETRSATMRISSGRTPHGRSSPGISTKDCPAYRPYDA